MAFTYAKALLIRLKCRCKHKICSTVLKIQLRYGKHFSHTMQLILKFQALKGLQTGIAGYYFTGLKYKNIYYLKQKFICGFSYFFLR